MNEESKTPVASTKLSTIFLVVLGLHVAVILAITAYHLLKGNTEMIDEPMMAESTEEVAPIADNNAETPMEPSLETTQNPLADGGTPEMTEAGPGMAMPSTSDPIWNDVDAPARLEVTRSAEVETPIQSQPVATTVQTAPVASGISYAVQKGDSLVRIAKKYNTTVQALRDANGITGDMIKIGQQLTIPGGSAQTVASSQPATVAPAPVKAPAAPQARSTAAANYASYKVAPGDTLWKISQTFGTKPSELAKLNGITDPSKLKVGMVIKVPASASQEASAPKATPVRTPVQNTDVAMVRE